MNTLMRVLETFICSLSHGNDVCNQIQLVKVNNKFMLVCEEKSITNDFISKSIYTTSEFEFKYRVNILDTEIGHAISKHYTS